MRRSQSQCLVLVGAFLNAFPLSMQSYFGNLLPYVDSYYYAHRDRIRLQVDPLWTSSTFVCTFIVGMIFSSPLERCLGIRPTLVVADVVMSFATLGGYFTVQEPLALAFVFGGSQGACVGIAYSMMIKLLLQTIPEHGGMATGIMSAGPVFGALVFVGVAYAVINPYNASPDLHVDDKVFFSDRGVIERVPQYFLVTGFITVVFALVGMTLMYLGSRTPAQDVGEEKEILTESISPGYTVEAGNKVALLFSDEDEFTPLQSDDFQHNNNSEKLNSKNSLTKKHQNGTLSSNGHCETVKKLQDTDSIGEPETLDDFSPREAVKTARFWLVWLAYVSSNHTNYIHLNLYKQYGQRVIPNDSLLVTAGMVSNAGMVIVRPLVGVLCDRFGIRGMNVLLNGVACLFMSLMVLALHTCPNVYIGLVIVEYIGVSPHTMLISLLTAYEFGKTHCGSNMGLIRSGNIVLVLLEPVLVKVLIRTLGWDWLFLSGALASVVATGSVVALDYCKV